MSETRTQAKNKGELEKYLVETCENLCMWV